MEHLQEDGGRNPGHPIPPGQLVQVIVDGVTKTVRKGKYMVSEFKDMVGVPVDYELDMVVGGKFDPLGDGDTVHIKGEEVFVSHVRRGGSS